MLPEVYHVIFDVDGVFTDGTFFYDSHGKCFKRFGPHDSDGIKLLRSANFSIEAITADKRGFPISKARNDYNFSHIYLISGIIYLNIAGLHDEPYSDFLYFLGLQTIFNHIKNSRL